MIKRNKPFVSLCLCMSQMIGKLFTRLKCNTPQIGKQEQGLSLNRIRNYASRQDGCLNDTDYL